MWSALHIAGVRSTSKTILFLNWKGPVLRDHKDRHGNPFHYRIKIIKSDWSTYMVFKNRPASQSYGLCIRKSWDRKQVDTGSHMFLTTVSVLVYNQHNRASFFQNVLVIDHKGLVSPPNWSQDGRCEWWKHVKKIFASKVLFQKVWATVLDYFSQNSKLLQSLVAIPIMRGSVE